MRMAQVTAGSALLAPAFQLLGSLNLNQTEYFLEESTAKVDYLLLLICVKTAYCISFLLKIARRKE